MIWYRAAPVGALIAVAAPPGLNAVTAMIEAGFGKPMRSVGSGMRDPLCCPVNDRSSGASQSGRRAAVFHVEAQPATAFSTGWCVFPLCRQAGPGLEIDERLLPAAA